jgi:hypothetical protein
LAYAEFPLVKAVWYHYRQQEPNLAEDRILGIFIDGTLAAVARCRLHKDGHEVLYMHATLQLIGFYKTFAFVPIPEDPLPTMTVRCGIIDNMIPSPD